MDWSAGMSSAEMLNQADRATAADSGHQRGQRSRKNRQRPPARREKSEAFWTFLNPLPRPRARGVTPLNSLITPAKGRTRQGQQRGFRAAAARACDNTTTTSAAASGQQTAHSGVEIEDFTPTESAQRKTARRIAVPRVLLLSQMLISRITRPHAFRHRNGSGAPPTPCEDDHPGECQRFSARRRNANCVDHNLIDVEQRSRGITA